MKVTRNTQGSARLSQAIADLQSKKLKVGWFETAKYEDGTPVAYVATIQEFGSPKNSIPARPFMRPTIEVNKQEWAGKFAAGSKKVMNGSLDVETVLGRFGMMVAAEIGATISTVSSPPLSPITLLLRQHKKEGGTVTGKTVGNAARASGYVPDVGAAKALGVSDKPLVETALMIQSISLKVEG